VWNFRHNSLSQDQMPVAALQKLARNLFGLSEARGKDVSGIVTVTEYQILAYKDAQKARLMLIPCVSFARRK
jgi:hypothetical protein